MTEANREHQLAKQAIQNLFELLRITTVINVDDKNNQPPGTYDVIGLIVGAYAVSPVVISGLFPNINFDVPEDVLLSTLSKNWEATPPHVRAKLIPAIAAVEKQDWVEDYLLTEKFTDSFPRRFKPNALSPSEWMEQRDYLLGNSSPDGRILCFFDQDLSKAEGFTDQGTFSGIGLIKDVLARFPRENVICALISYTIASTEDEMPTWRTLSEVEEINLRDFLPIAKIRLSLEGNPFAFVDGIKKTLLNTYCEDIKEITKTILEEANREAVKLFRNIDPYTFDHMVMLTSSEEGVSEVDTITRIFHILQKDEIRRLISRPERAAAFNELIQASRPISEIKISGQKFTGGSRFRKKELFEPVDLVIDTPLQTGDIFRLNSTGTTYFLLAQPCDLMVRTEGTRSIANLAVPLVPLVDEVNLQVASDKDSDFWHTHDYIEYFYDDARQIGIMAFKQACWISIGVLDLAILNNQDRCRIDLREENLPPIQLTSGWRTHLDTLKAKFATKADELDVYKREIDQMENLETRERLWKAIMPNFTLSDLKLPDVTYSERTFDFGLQRIGRYREPYSIRLLKNFTQFLSRDADEHDFAMQIEERN